MKATRLVLLLAALLFLCNIWGYDLWAPDEPFFGEGAREMLRDGHWLVSHINGKVNSHKPPLFFWLIALFSMPFGEVLSFTARLPSVLAAIGTVALTMRLGRRMADERTAALAGLVLVTSLMFWDKARMAQIDAVLCFLIWVALAAFEAYRAGDARGRHAGLLFWLAAVLAVLAKGPVGLLLPLGIALVILIFDRDIARWRGFAPLLGPLLFAVVAGLWIGAVQLWGPEGYTVGGALKEHFIDRGIHGMHHAQPFWYYLKVLPPQLLPWTGLVPGALLLAWRRRDPGDRFLLVASLFVILFFSISTEKRTLYALPALPAFALMTARLVGRILEWEGTAAISRRWATVGQGIVSSILVVAGLAVIFVRVLGPGVPVAPQYVELTESWMIWPLAIFLVVGGLAGVVLLGRGKLLEGLLAPAAAFAAAYLFVATFAQPAINPYKSSRVFSLKIQEATSASRAEGYEVLACGLGNLPTHFAFYTDGLYTIETNDAADLERHLERNGRVFAVVDEIILDELPMTLREEIAMVERTRLNRRDVALIANHTP